MGIGGQAKVLVYASGRIFAPFGPDQPERKEFKMKALCWYGKGDVRVENVKDPQL
jgi:hypothetical protein